MLESGIPGDNRKYITVAENAVRGDAARAEELRAFQDGVLSIALFTNHPALKDIDVRKLTEIDKYIFEKENLTLADIEKQESVILNATEIERAVRVYNQIQSGKVAGMPWEDMQAFARIKTGNLKRAEIKRELDSLTAKYEAVKDSIKLLEYLKSTVQKH